MRWFQVLLIGCWLVGCDCGGPTRPGGPSCGSASDCGNGLVCVEGRCIPPTPGIDGGARCDGVWIGVEQCDGLDNDCDGHIDEGFEACLGRCAPGCTIIRGAPQPGGWMPNDENSEGVIVDPEGALTLGRGNTLSAAVWIANTGEGTVSKLDLRTGREVARYPSVGRNAPPGSRPWNEACTWGDSPNPPFGNCPSRTAVDQNFDAYVANRAFGSQGSVTKYAANQSDCIDRNGNGVLETSRDLNGDGRIDLRSAEFVGPEDECILWTTGVSNPDGSLTPNEVPRALAVGLAPPDHPVGNVWVGHFNTREMCELSSRDGRTIRCISTGNANPYGAAADQMGRIWVVSREDGGSGEWLLTFIDPLRGSHHRVSQPPDFTMPDLPRPCRSSDGTMHGYGITIDRGGRVYVSMSDCGPAVYRYDPSSDRWSPARIPGNGIARGVAADDTHLWVTLSHHRVGDWGSGCTRRLVQLRLSDLTLVNDWSIPTGECPIGVGVGFDGSIWTVARMANLAARLNPRTGTWTEHPVGVAPYTYSDFIGYGLNAFAQPRGHYRFISDGCAGAMMVRWVGAALRAEIPLGTTIEVFARTANDREALRRGAWIGPFIVSPSRPQVDFTRPPGPLPDGRFIEIEVRLRTEDRRVVPRLFHIDLAYFCEVGLG
ncbi:MAG: hypothetical protein RMJ84_05305 [Sandaracinaceae bacterium]|nr:hypothetical protein [Sandaracinaceae bacterium]